MGLFKRWALGIICVGSLVVLIFRDSNSSKSPVSPFDTCVSPVAIAQKEMPQLEVPPVDPPHSWGRFRQGHAWPSQKHRDQSRARGFTYDYDRMILIHDSLPRPALLRREPIVARYFGRTHADP